MSEKGQVQFGETLIRYTVARSSRRKKTVSISVAAEGTTVAAPVTTPSDRLEQVVLERGAWIVRKQARISRLLESAEPPRRFVNGESLRYLGRQYRIKRVPGQTAVKLRGRYFEVPDWTPSEVRDALIAWYRERALSWLSRRVELYGRRLGRRPAAVLIRDQRKRWGSCNEKGELRFNWRIIMAPIPLVDYIVAHELVHLEHLNHSPRFWKRLRQIIPNHKDLREELDRQGSRFTFL